MEVYRSPNQGCSYDGRPPAGQRRFSPDFKLCFKGLKPEDATRAIFTFPFDDDRYKRSSYIWAEFTSSEMDGVTQLRPPIGVRCVDMFITQVRGGLNDCSVPGLHIDALKREFSFEWKTLYDLFFSDKACRKLLIEEHAVSVYAHRKCRRMR